MSRLVIAAVLALFAQEASAQCAGQHVNYFWVEGCRDCASVKAYLDRNRIPHESFNMDLPNVQDYLGRRFGMNAAPTVESRGRIVIGYDPRALDDLLCIRRR